MTSIGQARQAMTRSTIRMRRSTAAGLLLAATGFMLPSLTTAHAAAACQYAAGIGGGWTKLATPPFTVGPTSTNRYRYYPFIYGGGALYGLVPGNGQVLLATNGSQIMRSTNRGCTWNAVYTYQGGDLGQDPPQVDQALQPTGEDSSAATGELVISAFAFPRYQSHQQRLYALIAPSWNVAGPALVAQLVMGVPATFITSSDDGQTWSSVTPSPSASAPAIPDCAPPDSLDQAVRLAVAPSDPKVLYLACGGGAYGDAFIGQAANGARSDLRLYESTDGAVSWVQRTTPTTEAQGVPMQGLAIDPQHPERLWLATNESTTATATGQSWPSAWYSSDSGRTWASRAVGGKASYDGDPAFAMSVAYCCGEFGVDVSPTGDASVANATGGVLFSRDSGKHWSTYATGGGPAGTMIVHSVFAPNGDLYALRDIGVPPKYEGPAFCANGVTSYEQLVRVRNGRTAVIATPRPAIGDFFGLQTTGSAHATTILGFGQIRQVPNNCDQYQALGLLWTGSS